MTEIDTKTLKEGMQFSSPLLFDDGKNMFLAERMPIGKMHLDSVKRWNIEKVITYGKQLEAGDDGSEDLELLDELDEDEENPLYTKYIQIIKGIEKVFAAYEKGATIEKSLVDDSVKSIYGLLSEEHSFMTGISFVSVKGHSQLAVNAVNIATISAVIATEMKFPQKEILMLITAALLHDIGMVKQPEKIVNKPGKLTEDEYIRIKTHSQKVLTTILETLSYPKEVAVIVLQHHERWDGKGYPEGKAGKEIYLPARVLAVADSFEAMLSEKPYRDAYAAHDAVKTLLTDKETKFDPAVLKAFISCIGLYPVGSYAQLSDNSIAKIVKVNPAAPFFPTVKITVSKSVALPENFVLDLQTQKDVTITRALKQSEVNAV